MGRHIEKITKKSINLLEEYEWPGNIRELKNLVENAMIISKGKQLRIYPPIKSPSIRPKFIKLEDVTRNHIKDVLRKTTWRVRGPRGAAELLGLKPTTLEARMKKLGISRPQ
jgi:transcriptional regulator with GAF, ATPase, and Fis domain